MAVLRTRDRSSAERIRALLHARVGEALTLDEIVREVSLSRAYVVHSFKRAFGVTPYEYLMHLRVGCAREAPTSRAPRPRRAEWPSSRRQ